MLVTVASLSGRAQPVQTEAERDAADPAGLGFAPDAPGAALGSDPAGTMTRKRASTGWDRARNKAPWSGRGSWATRTRENAAVERREASTLRYWVLDASLGVQAV